MNAKQPTTDIKSDDRPPLIIRPGEVITVKEAAFRAAKNRKTVIDLVTRFKIGRQLSATGPIEIHKAAFEMALAGDDIAVELLRAGERSNLRVVRYFVEAGLPV